MVAEHSKSNILEVMKERRNFSHMALARTCPFVDVPLHDNKKKIKKRFLIFWEVGEVQGVSIFFCGWLRKLR